MVIFFNKKPTPLGTPLYRRPPPMDTPLYRRPPPMDTPLYTPCTFSPIGYNGTLPPSVSRSMGPL